MHRWDVVVGYVTEDDIKVPCMHVTIACIIAFIIACIIAFIT